MKPTLVFKELVRALSVRQIAAKQLSSQHPSLLLHESLAVSKDQFKPRFIDLLSRMHPRLPSVLLKYQWLTCDICVRATI